MSLIIGKFVSKDYRNALKASLTSKFTLSGQTTTTIYICNHKYTYPSPAVIHGHSRWGHLWFRHHRAVLDELIVHRVYEIAECVKAFGHVSAGLLERRVLRHRRLEIRVGDRARVAELHLRGEHTSAGADTPSHQWLRDALLSQCLAHLVLLDATNLAQQDDQLRVRIVLVAHYMVHEGRAGVTVAADRHALEDPVRCC